MQNAAKLRYLFERKRLLKIIRRLLYSVVCTDIKHVEYLDSVGLLKVKIVEWTLSGSPLALAREEIQQQILLFRMPLMVISQMNSPLSLT